MTYTYAVLEVSAAAYEEIKAKLEAAGYAQVFHDDAEHGTVIDMHGIALASEPKPEHFTFEDWFDREDEAREASREAAVKLINLLKDAGFTTFKPLPRPSGFVGPWDEFAECRILIGWLPDWIENEHAGKFSLRVDTYASQ